MDKKHERLAKEKETDSEPEYSVRFKLEGETVTRQKDSSKSPKAREKRNETKCLRL